MEKSMIYRDEIYSNIIKRMFKKFKDTKMYVDILVIPNKDLEVLPKEAFKDGLLHAAFDYNAESSWGTDQIEFTDTTMKCALTYLVDGEWTTHYVEFPIINIVGITNTEISYIKEETEEFLLKVQESKKHLRFPNKE